MKKILSAFSTVVAVIFISSCSGPKKTVEKPAAVKQEVKATAPAAEKTVPPAEPVKSADELQAPGVQRTANFTGEQFIQNLGNRLNNRLALNESQRATIKNNLTSAFLSLGNDLGKTYTRDEAKVLTGSVLQSASPKILEVLDAGQKERFQTFLQH
jgi:hypothetical protein